MAEIIADGQTLSTIDDAVYQGKGFGVLYLLAKDRFKHVVVYRGVELAYVDFEAVQWSAVESTDESVNTLGASFYAPSCNAGVRVTSESARPNGFENVHNGVLRDSIRVIGQLENQAFLRLIYRKTSVGACPERAVGERLMQLQEKRIPVLVEGLNLLIAGLAATCEHIGDFEVVQVDDVLKYVAYSLHNLCFVIGRAFALRLPTLIPIHYFFCQEARLTSVCFVVVPRADPPIDVAGYVVRVDVAEPRIRPIVRIAAEKNSPSDVQPVMLKFV